VFVSLLSLSFACGFELFTLTPRLDLGAVIVVVACVYFDIDYYFPLLHTSKYYFCECVNVNVASMSMIHIC